MKSSEPEDNQISEEELKEQLDEIVSSVDTGARDTTSGAGKILAFVALVWSLSKSGLHRLFPT